MTRQARRLRLHRIKRQHWLRQQRERSGRVFGPQTLAEVEPLIEADAIADKVLP